MLFLSRPFSIDNERRQATAICNSMLYRNVCSERSSTIPLASHIFAKAESRWIVSGWDEYEFGSVSCYESAEYLETGDDLKM